LADLKRSDLSQPTAAGRRAPHLPVWMAVAAYVFVTLATVAVLVLHTINAAGAQGDTTSLGLLGLLLLVPLAPYIMRLKAGALGG
jgi:predicted exporter